MITRVLRITCEIYETEFQGDFWKEYKFDTKNPAQKFIVVFEIYMGRFFTNSKSIKK